jgi:hypothetical protein
MKPRSMETPLTDDEKPRRWHTYWVTGRGQFPFDMLRYDQAWPADSDAASKLSAEESIYDRRSVKLYSYRPPTVDRWNSFGWSPGIEEWESSDG